MYASRLNINYMSTEKCRESMHKLFSKGHKQNYLFNERTRHLRHL